MGRDNYDRHKVKGERKRKLTVHGREIRAMQDAIEHFGYGYIDQRRQSQVRDLLIDVVERYRDRDRIVDIAEGVNE